MAKVYRSAYNRSLKNRLKYGRLNNYRTKRSHTIPTVTSAPAAGSITATGFTISATADDAVSLKVVVVADGATAPTAAQVKALSGGVATGSDSAAAAEAAAAAITGLTAETAYDAYALAVPVIGDIASAPTKVDVTTTA